MLQTLLSVFFSALLLMTSQAHAQEARNGMTSIKWGEITFNSVLAFTIVATIFALGRMYLHHRGPRNPHPRS